MKVPTHVAACRREGDLSRERERERCACVTDAVVRIVLWPGMVEICTRLGPRDVV